MCNNRWQERTRRHWIHLSQWWKPQEVTVTSNTSRPLTGVGLQSCLSIPYANYYGVTRRQTRLRRGLGEVGGNKSQPVKLCVVFFLVFSSHRHWTKLLEHRRALHVIRRQTSCQLVVICCGAGDVLNDVLVAWIYHGWLNDQSNIHGLDWWTAPHPSLGDPRPHHWWHILVNWMRITRSNGGGALLRPPFFQPRFCGGGKPYSDSYSKSMGKQKDPTYSLVWRRPPLR